ncbi:MAG: 23S rRNA pseudouridine2604 synthase [Phenylobacterium sp.]|jgi:23S rRNA pseudouridine2604 synthase
MSSELKRLNKYISESGICSRREADKLIEQGKVTFNGEVALMGTKVGPGDIVTVNGQPLAAKKPPLYLAYNKPIGITCTTERQIEGNIIDAIGHKERIFPIGRLDKPSEGLIFLTNDGDIVNKILRAGNNHEKEYVVTVDKPIDNQFIQKMAAGVAILDTVTQPCRVRQNSRFVFNIILTQGLNRQIRRMCETLGYEVTKLKRTRIMNISAQGLSPGKWRLLSDDELAQIHTLTESSDKTEQASSLKKSAGTKESVSARSGRPTSGQTPDRAGHKSSSSAAKNQHRPSAQRDVQTPVRRGRRG